MKKLLSITAIVSVLCATTTHGMTRLAMRILRPVAAATAIMKATSFANTQQAESSQEKAIARAKAIFNEEFDYKITHVPYKSPYETKNEFESCVYNASGIRPHEYTSEDYCYRHAGGRLGKKLHEEHPAPWIGSNQPLNIAKNLWFERLREAECAVLYHAGYNDVLMGQKSIITDKIIAATSITVAHKKAENSRNPSDFYTLGVLAATKDRTHHRAIDIYMERQEAYEEYFVSAWENNITNTK